MRVTRVIAAVALTALAFAGGAVSVADAQGRGRPSGGGGRVGSGRSVVVVPRVYSPRFYGGYYRPYFYSPFYYYGYYDPWFVTPYAPYYYGYWGGAAYAAANRSSVRLQVEPRNTEVFVDGYFAGVVDEFDGVFQRLQVEPGQHEVTLWLQGFRTVRQQLYLSPGGDFRVRHTMEPVAAGEAAEPRPEAPPVQPQAAPSPMPQRRMMPPITREAPPERAREAERQPAPSGRYGRLAVQVQPGGADVEIDGQVWQGPEGSSRLVVNLAPGTHRVVVRKDGFDVFSTSVTVAPDQTTELNVSLLRQEEAR